jgi:hypothetical protein
MNVKRLTIKTKKQTKSWIRDETFRTNGRVFYGMHNEVTFMLTGYWILT